MVLAVELRVRPFEGPYQDRGLQWAQWWSEILGQLKVVPPQVKTEYRLLNTKIILFTDYVKSFYQYL
jgi:hypothetical protein